jgi:hypothetical protein
MCALESAAASKMATQYRRSQADLSSVGVAGWQRGKSSVLRLSTREDKPDMNAQAQIRPDLTVIASARC